MRKVLFTLVGFFVFLTSKAQMVQGFESITLDSGKVLNGLLGETEFQFNLLHMPTFWDTSFGGYWASGWALSRKYDSSTVTSNYAKHLYCNKAFKGNAASNTFSVGQNNATFFLDHAGLRISSFFICNTTYAYNSMKLGDAFAKKFGGASGHDSDFFVCTVKSFFNGVLQDSQEVFLADFRSSDSTKDFILSQWQKVNISGIADSLTFSLSSSDNSSWGMNTPAFFAVDDIEMQPLENIRETKNNMVNCYPNPAKNDLYLQSKSGIHEIRIFSANGQLHYTGNANGSSILKLNCDSWGNGVYFAEIDTINGRCRTKLIVWH